VKLNSAQELEAKKTVIHRIVSHLNQVPPNAVNELLREGLPSLEQILERLSTKREHEQIQQDAQAQINEMREASKKDGAWAHCLLKVRLNNKVLADTDANRQMLENMLAPHETPSAAIYETIALSYPQKFSWIASQPAQSAVDREAEFQKICREHSLSLCDANRELYGNGISLDAWAGASALERTKFQDDAARARQDYLIHHATPDELKAEARFQSQTEHAAAVRADAERREKFVADQQRGLYPPLPLVNGCGERMDAAYFRKISTTDYQLFRALVRRHGTNQITSRLRGEV
jgi:hypothetical protein